MKMDVLKKWKGKKKNNNEDGSSKVSEKIK